MRHEVRHDARLGSGTDSVALTSAARRMRSRLAATGFGLVAFLVAGSVAAQDDAADLSGRRVRLRLSAKKPQVGRVLSVGEKDISLRLEPRGEVAHVGWADIERLEVSRGKQGNTLKGLLGGAAAWGIMVGLIAAFDTLDESGVAEPVVIGGFLGGGALVGRRIQTEKWREVPVPTVGGSAAGNGTGFRLEFVVRFS